MSERAKSSLLKIRSSDGDEFEFDDESVEEIETLKTMTMLNDDKDVPTCAINSKASNKVHLWIKPEKFSWCCSF